MGELHYVRLGEGEPGPWFQQRSAANPRYVFDTAAGRYLVLCFFGSSIDAHSAAAIGAVKARRDIFDDIKASFFGVSIDSGDEREKRISNSLPGVRFFWDFDGVVSRLYGALPKSDEDNLIPNGALLRRGWFILDPTLRIMKIVPFREDRSDIGQVISYLEALPPPERFAGFKIQAPVLILQNIFSMDLCERLIRLYEVNGGSESGFMRQVDGKTVGVVDYSHKRRKDYVITDTDIIRETQIRISRCIAPELLKVHQFRATRMERYIVACYDAEEGAHFRQHRDNTTAGTAHRRFAVSINLNHDFEGGDVSFPEYGNETYRPPLGGAVVFSCSLLHAVSKVTAGRRYAFLPFLYDEEGARVREANAGNLAQKSNYRANAVEDNSA